MPRYLTKSRYRMACECPTKLFYTRKDTYQDNSQDDPFLEALRDGGFQVGRLAQLYYEKKGPSVLIGTLKEAEALAQTQTELQKDRIILFEAAFHWNNLFIRADIVEKQGNLIRLVEVKSKSFNPDNPKKPILKQDGLPQSDWEPTFQDLAFQTYVLREMYPNLEVQPYLMLLDKRKQAPVDRMNSYFFLKKTEDKKNPVVEIRGTIPEDMVSGQNWIVLEYAANEVVSALQGKDYDGKNFKERINEWAQAYADDKKIDPILSTTCKTCQFRAAADERKAGKFSGFHECWREKSSLSDKELDGALVLDMWNSRKVDSWISEGKYRLASLQTTDVPDPKTKTASKRQGWTQVERQRYQIDCVRERKQEPVVDVEGLRTDLSKWVYPLHFIDFETIRGAIPFHKDSAPYEQVAFQFSHHHVEEDRTIRHQGQWIKLDRGVWPNHEFLKELKLQLDKDGGTVLHFAHHERTVISDLCGMLEGKDRELVAWFRNLIGEGADRETNHGQRHGRLVDMREILLGRYYHPGTGGSNSLKDVLPAILGTEGPLRAKYSQADYGTGKMPSLNLKEGKVWIREGSSNPYECLPKICEVCPDLPEDVERVFGDQEIDQGGAAMMAYAKAQFTECSDQEVEGLREALLQYCELDTLAMVMLWEEWRRWIDKNQKI